MLDDAADATPPAPTEATPAPVVPALDATGGVAESSIGAMLEACRAYLLLVANEEIANDIRHKIAPSDCVQETLCEALQAFNAFRGTNQQELRWWLREILLHNIVDATRAFRATGKRNIAREVPLNGYDSQEGLAEQLTDPRPSPSRHAIAAEARLAVLQALDRLDLRARQIVRWKNFDDLTFIEIGSRIGLTEDGARKAWTRAIKELATVMRNVSDESG